MTPSEFAKTIRIKHPGMYDDLDDDTLTMKVLSKYPQYQDMVTAAQATPTGFPEPQASDNPAAGAEVPAEQKLANNVQAVGSGAALGVGVPAAAMGIAKGLAAVPEAAGNAISSIKSMLPNPSIKGLGFTPANVATEAGQNLASGARDYAVNPQPEIGQLIAKAQGGATPMSQGLATPEELAETDAATGHALPNTAPDTAAQTTIFNQPIAQGMANSSTQMRDLTNEQWKQAGDAIGNTLSQLDHSGKEFDPQPILQQINGMFLRDAEGKVMDTGVQGSTNEALKEAVDTLNDYSKGQPISWTDANKIKGMLQNSANYAAKRFDESNEAYKQAASLIKEGIDDQAGDLLAKTGGDVQNFQALRGAYSKLSALRGALNPQAGKDLLQPTLPERVLSAAKAHPVFTGLSGYGAYKVGKELF